MTFCDFLAGQRKRVAFLGDGPEGPWPSLLYFGVERMRPGGRGRPCKDHPTCYLVLTGRAWAGDADGRQSLAPGGGLFCPAYATKDLQADPETGCTWTCLGWDGAELSRACAGHGLARKLVFDDARMDGQVADRMAAIAAEIDRPGPLSPSHLAAQVQLLVGALLRTHGSRDAPSRPRQHQAIAHALGLIARHSGELAGVADLARQVGLERSYFSRLFRSETGRTVGTALRDARLRRARELLERPELTIQAVASLCGYGEYPTFYRAFVRATGCTPSAWRDRRD